MHYARYKPRPPLDAFVEYLWSLRDAPLHAKELIMPNGTLELVINLVEDEIRVYSTIEAARPERHAGCVVSGAFDRPFVIDTREHAAVVGAHFRPGGAVGLVATPADALADTHVALADLWSPATVARLRERLCVARTDALRFQLLEQALLERVGRCHDRQQLVRAALDQMQRTRIAVHDLVATAGVTHRHFIKLFAQEVGMTPKMYLRVQRFQRVLALTERSSTPQWPLLAQQCGYYDQAHLIRDFHCFAGVTPTQYVGWRSAKVKDNHVPLPVSMREAR